MRRAQAPFWHILTQVIHFLPLFAEPQLELGMNLLTENLMLHSIQKTKKLNVNRIVMLQFEIYARMLF